MPVIVISLGWSRDPGPHHGEGSPSLHKNDGGFFLRHFVLVNGVAVSTLSIFVDESGDFGESSLGYYVVSMVFHEQKQLLQKHLDVLQENLTYTDMGDHTVHSGAAIRGEAEYRNISLNVRKAVVDRLFSFVRSAPIYHETLFFKRKDVKNRLALEAAISRGLGGFLQELSTYFRCFDNVIIYYDNGQAELTRILNVVMNAYFLNVEFRNVAPSEYRLFQAADLYCTLELLRGKDEDNALTKSDLYFFESARKLRQQYLKKISKKRLPST